VEGIADAVLGLLCEAATRSSGDDDNLEDAIVRETASNNSLTCANADPRRKRTGAARILRSLWDPVDPLEAQMQRQGWDLPALVAASMAHDERAWDELVCRFAGLVLFVVRSYRLSGQDEQDVSRLVWLRLVEHLDQINDDPAVLPDWLAETTRRECEKLVRFRPDTEVTRRSRLLVAIGMLTPADQDLLKMLSADPRPSDEEIGRTLGIPLDEFAPARARVLAAVRANLTAEAA
jgi:DNA-directed RNA polymerase specialized sigma24 family protein